MADFSVLIYTLENKSSSLNDYKKKLKSYSSKVQSIKNSMPLNGDVGIQIKKAMKEIGMRNVITHRGTEMIQ